MQSSGEREIIEGRVMRFGRCFIFGFGFFFFCQMDLDSVLVLVEGFG